MNDSHIQLITRRTTMLYAVVLIIGALIVGRLFQLQVLQHDHYVALAVSEHEAKFIIPAARGAIYALDGEDRVPLVLNEVRPTVYVDPFGIDDTENDTIASSLSDVIGVEKQEILRLLADNDLRYQVVKKQLSPDEAEAIRALNLNGVGLSDESFRVYPQGAIAAQMLGFVNDGGLGQYGLEAFMNDELAGVDGRFEAVTDVYGIPLSTSEERIIAAPRDGTDMTLTIDVNVQQFVEDALKKGVVESRGKSGSAIVMNPNNGAVIAMANYPSYNPDNFAGQDDFSVFQNRVVNEPYETGSGMKVLTMAAALNEKAVSRDSTYFDAGFVQVDDRRIENAGNSVGGTRTMTEVIQRSVNTGVVYALQQLGGGEINEQARSTLYDYFTNRFGFGSPTGLAQDNEAGGLLYGPADEQGNNVRYANMTFGQGMTVTMLQMAAAVSAVINGGDYYQPYLVHETHDQGESQLITPMALRNDVVSDATSQDIRKMMRTVVDSGGGFSARRDGYMVGGKTGTAQVLDTETGEYSDEREIGSFVGFGGSAQPEYVIMTRVDEPEIPGYAGTVAAAPIFADISNFMIDYWQIPPSR